MPDDVGEVITSAMRKFGSDPFEPIYLAAERNSVLVSDDLHFRVLAGACAKVRSGWIQAFLLAAQRRREFDLPSYTRLVVRLAHYRHYLVQFNEFSLIELFQSDRDPKLADFSALCRFFGGASANMPMHCNVALGFLHSEWDASCRDLRLPRATSIILGSLIFKTGRIGPSGWR